MQIDATSNFAVWMKLSSSMEISGTTGVTEIRKRQVQRYYIKLYASYNIKHLDNTNVSVEPMEIHGTSPTTMYVLFDLWMGSYIQNDIWWKISRIPNNQHLFVMTLLSSFPRQQNEMVDHIGTCC